MTCHAGGPSLQPRLPHAGASAWAQSPSHSPEDTDHPGSSSKGRALGTSHRPLQTRGPPCGVPHRGPHRAGDVVTCLPCPRGPAGSSQHLALSKPPWASSQHRHFLRDPGYDRHSAGVQVPSFLTSSPLSGDRSVCSHKAGAHPETRGGAGTQPRTQPSSPGRCLPPALPAPESGTQRSAACTPVCASVPTLPPDPTRPSAPRGLGPCKKVPDKG